ncbi:MAG: HEAT repeat domain-containing protein, partial [Planctomycetota bacterium]
LANQIVIAASTRNPERRAAAETRLAAADRHARLHALVRRLDHGYSPVRIYAAEKILALGERGAVGALVRRCVREPNRNVRRHLTAVLRAFDEPETAALFVRHLADPEPAHRFRTLQNLGVFRDRRVVPVLVRRLRLLASGFPQAAASFTTERAYIRGWRLISGGTGNQVVEVPDPEIDVLRTGVRLEVRVRLVEIQLTVELLRDLTGQRLGAEPAAWERWLAEHPDAPLAPPAP